MKYKPVLILFVLQVILFFVAAIIIFAINFLLDADFTLQVFVFVIAMFPALVFKFQSVMKIFEIKNIHAIFLTKIMAWLQLFPIVYIVIEGFLVEELTLQETVFLLLAGLLVMYFIRYLGISMIKKT